MYPVMTLGVLHGMAWYVFLDYGVVFTSWYGIVWYGIVVHGEVWYSIIYHIMVWYGMVWCGMVWDDIVWYGMGCDVDAVGHTCR